MTFSLRLSACSGIPYTCSMPGREKSKPTDVGPGRKAKDALQSCCLARTPCAPTPDAPSLTIRLAVSVGFECLLPGSWLLFLCLPLGLFWLRGGKQTPAHHTAALSSQPVSAVPSPTARRSSGSLRAFPPQPPSQPSAPTTPPTHLPCHHPQVLPRAGRHRPQLGLLILAWKVGELSAPIQRGQGRGASGRRGEGIESQGSKGTKAMEEGTEWLSREGPPMNI